MRVAASIVGARHSATSPVLVVSHEDCSPSAGDRSFAAFVLKETEQVTLIIALQQIVDRVKVCVSLP